MRLTVNQHPPLEVAASGSLLSALKTAGIFIPSACGGRGICGLCRVTISPAPPPTERDRLHLTEAELQSGLRLSCQTPMDRDYAITIPEDYFHAREYKAQVTDIRDLTYDIKELKLRAIDPPALAFKAGQYIQLRIPPYGQVKRIHYRAFSIASDPDERQTIELEIRRVLNGLGTTYVFDHLKAGDRVFFNGPHGSFYLQDTARPILMIAGGSGMAPMKSILGLLSAQHSARACTYFFGAKSRRDLFLVETMRDLERRLPAFRFVPALSEPLPEDHWDGETGLITEVVSRHVPRGFNGEAYLCGSPGMIDACLAVLKAKGLAADRIFFDKFA